MCGAQIDGTRHTCFSCILPSLGTHTPSVSWLEAWEIESWSGRDQVISLLPGELEKGGCDLTTHGVQTPVIAVGVTTSVPEPTSQGVGRTWFKFFAKDVE